VLNALFTLMSLYQHPALLHHLFLLCRWRLPADAAELRAAYCSGGGGGQARAGERAHVAVVVALLHLTVVCQYALCWLYWCFTRNTRPDLVEDGFTALGVAAPIFAVVYTMCSPLGSDTSGDLDAPSVTAQCPSTLAHADAVVVVEPEWAGGMFDCDGSEAAAAGCCLSLSCTFCVFGWNAERLGFGNACVHAATFALLCLAPLWVFGVTALRVHDAAVGDVVGGAGVLLCVGGLLYGGYWRVQMRRKFGLPGSAACCGSKSATDYASWLFCWPCALAQEVRTASLYHVHGESFFHRIPAAAAGDHEPLLTPGTSASAESDEHLVVVLLRDEMVPPPVVQVVVVADNDTCLECNVVHVQEKIEPPFPTSAVDVEEENGSSSLASNQEEPVDQRLSGGRWRVEKLKRMINVVTMVSLLFLLYTRGFIR
jgi:Cys-rich protein (TIGR01571 family)